MQETNTVIMWPEKLKVGSKSKRGKFVSQSLWRHQSRYQHTFNAYCDNVSWWLLFCVDPHVRVAGEPEGVRAARERVMAVLDTRVSRTLCFMLPVFF